MGNHTLNMHTKHFIFIFHQLWNIGTFLVSQMVKNLPTMLETWDRWVRKILWRREQQPIPVFFSSVQSLSCARLFATPWTTLRQASLSITNSQSLLKLMSIELVMAPKHLILCRPLLLLPFNLSQHQGLFKWVSSGHQVAKVLEFQFQHQSFQWIFKTDFLLEGLVGSPCRPSDSQVFSNTTVQKHQFISAQLSSSSHPYMTTGKAIALTRWTFVGKVMSLLFNMLSKLVITFLPRSKCLLISWLRSSSAVILETKKIVSHCFHCFTIYSPRRDGTRSHDLCFLNVEL